MKDVFIKISGLSAFDQLFPNKLFINGEDAASFKGEEFVIKRHDDDAIKMRLDFFGGLYSTECEIPAGDKPCVVSFDNKRDRFFKRIVLSIILVTIIEVVFIRILPIWICYALLFGSFLIWACTDLINRKKKFAVSVTVLE